MRHCIFTKPPAAVQFSIIPDNSVRFLVLTPLVCNKEPWTNARTNLDHARKDGGFYGCCGKIGRRFNNSAWWISPQTRGRATHALGCRQIRSNVSSVLAHPPASEPTFSTGLSTSIVHSESLTEHLRDGFDRNLIHCPESLFAGRRLYASLAA